jgi:hypothetical protein
MLFDRNLKLMLCTQLKFSADGAGVSWSLLGHYRRFSLKYFMPLSIFTCFLIFSLKFMGFKDLFFISELCLIQ